MQMWKKINVHIISILLSELGLILSFGCSEPDLSEVSYVDQKPVIYPDYTDIVIPPNIAPLNFMVPDSIDRVVVTMRGTEDKMKIEGKHKIFFRIDRFNKFLEAHKGDTLWIEVATLNKKQWTKYLPFFWFVANEPIDQWLSYRLIEPGYEVWNKINLSLRNVSNFEEKVLADNNQLDGACMNCHIGNQKLPGKSFFHLRHPERGGTIINENGDLRKIDTSTEGTISSGVYGNWHPGGRFIAFSTNIIIPEFYSTNDMRMEVYDTTSDLVVLDIRKNEIFSGNSISKPGQFETFPEFSADGERLFFCVADSVVLPEDYKSLKYSLCSVDFFEETRSFGDCVDTLFSAKKHDKTVSEPRVSPDGQYLLFTVFDYGTFPIWHPEARLNLIDLKNGEINELPEINNNKKYSNSYHCWASNSRWIVFASKRDDGLYGKPYFAYIDKEGQGHKPFVLPQKDPEFYDYFYKSFNIPELFSIQPGFEAEDIEDIFSMSSEKVTPVGIEYNGSVQ